MNILCATEPATGDPDCPSCHGHARPGECSCVMVTLTDAERTDRECFRRLRAAAVKHSMPEADVRTAVDQLRARFDVTQAEALDAVENLCMQPKYFEART